MILHKVLAIAGTEYPLISDDITLDIKRPGKAIFTVNADKPLKGLVSYEIGYNPNKLKQWFFGFVESSTTLDNKQQRIIARELTAVLQYPLFLNLRHVTIADVLAKITEKTEINFTLGKGDYSEQTTPFFYSMGNGYHCLDSIGPAFNIPRFIWQQEANATVYVGSWADSHWAKKPVPLDNEWLTNFAASQRADVPVMPPIRPGVQLRGLGYVNEVRLKGETMAIAWDKRL